MNDLKKILTWCLKMKISFISNTKKCINNNYQKFKKKNISDLCCFFLEERLFYANILMFLFSELNLFLFKCWSVSMSSMASAFYFFVRIPNCREIWIECEEFDYLVTARCDCTYGEVFIQGFCQGYKRFEWGILA